MAPLEPTAEIELKLSPLLYNPFLWWRKQIYHSNPKKTIIRVFLVNKHVLDTCCGRYEISQRDFFNKGNYNVKSSPSAKYILVPLRKCNDYSRKKHRSCRSFKDYETEERKICFYFLLNLQNHSHNYFYCIPKLFSLTNR